MHIVIPDDYQDAVRGLDCYASLADHHVTVYCDPPASFDELVVRLRDAEALVLIRERTAIDSALLERLPRLKLISQTGKISNHIDLPACTNFGVAVAEGVGSPVAPAELCWALIMASSRRLPEYREAMRAGHWQATGDRRLGRILQGLTLGIWGYGKIGRLVAGYGRAFGMEVLVWGRGASREEAQAHGHRAATDRAEFFAESDVLSLHLRLTEATRGCVGLDDLRRMKPDALFVNISRAELVAAGALEEALSAGRPGFAALDVYEREPMLGTEQRLVTMDNVLCTPHIGYVEKASYELYFGRAFANVLAFAGGRPQNIANPSSL